MKYLSNKKIAYVSIMAVMLLGLSACGGGGSTPAATTGGGTTGGGTTGGGTTGGGTTGGSTACTDIPGEPDIMGQITFTPSTFTSDPSIPPTEKIVMMNIPIDAETTYVGVTLSNATFGPGGVSTDGAGGSFVPATSTVAETLQVPVIMLSNTQPDSYFPSIVICSGERGACESTTGSTGTAVTYATVPLFDSDFLARFKNFENGSSITPTVADLANPTASCVTKPVLTVTTP